jgi:hypothetical protein
MYDGYPYEILVDDLQLSLLKNVESEGRSYRFCGVASDESPDMSSYNDEILRKSLDLTYAQRRGFVNWDHSREPQDQLGFLTRAEVIPLEKIAEYEERVGRTLNPTASVYVEGNLYKNVKKVEHVLDILSSVDAGGEGSLGLSLDGASLRDRDTHKLLKAIVRGVAITPSPAHVKTFCSLKKSLEAVSDGGIIDGLTFDAAVIRIMEMRPHISLKLAKNIVRWIVQKKQSVKTGS